MFFGKKLSNVVVTGSEGQLGSAFCRRLGSAALPNSRLLLDISDIDAVEGALTNAEAVINCAAMTDVSKCDVAPERAWAANVQGASNLAEVAGRRNIPFFHISTDFVFGQNKNRDHPYDEINIVNPLNLYGYSKLCGEYEVMKWADEYYPWQWHIIRTAGLFCMPDTKLNAKNFFNTISEVTKSFGHAEVVDDVHTNFTRAEDLVEAILWMLVNVDEVPYGAYHITNPGTGTWYDAAELFLGSDKVCRVSNEPAYTCLSLRKYIELGGPELPLWTEAVRELAAASQ